MNQKIKDLLRMADYQVVVTRKSKGDGVVLESPGGLIDFRFEWEGEDVVITNDETSATARVPSYIYPMVMNGVIESHCKTLKYDPKYIFYRDEEGNETLKKNLYRIAEKDLKKNEDIQKIMGEAPFMKESDLKKWADKCDVRQGFETLIQVYKELQK